MADVNIDFDLERLKAEIQQEQQMREMLDQSTGELRATVEELEKRFDSLEDEGNEWKVRYETQEEMNQQLQRQQILLQSKVEEAKRNLKDAEKRKKLRASRTPRDMRNFQDLSEANLLVIQSLEKEEKLLENQLRDIEWRLDQESKAYHKANEERKWHVTEINAAKGSLDEMKMRQNNLMVTTQQQQAEMMQMTGRSSRNSRNTEGNIPDDQRILDPRKGPIKKTAGVKNLPSLD